MQFKTITLLFILLALFIRIDRATAVLPPDRLEEERETEFLIFPNPAESEIRVSIKQFRTDTYRFAILDITGKVLLQGELDFRSGNQSERITISELPRGTYFFRLEDEDGHTTVKRIKKL